MDNIQNSPEVAQKSHHCTHTVSKKAMTVAVFLFILIILGMCIFAVLKKAELENNSVPSTEQETSRPS